MMVKLFLCSYFAAVSSFVPQFVGGDLKGKVLAFIPTASLHEKHTEYVDEAKQAFENMGLKVEMLDVSSAPKELTERTLQRCDLIYVSGGNTFFLLQELEKFAPYDNVAIIARTNAELSEIADVSSDELIEMLKSYVEGEYE